MNQEFFNAREALEKTKGIPKEYMIEKVEAALANAYKREYNGNQNVRVVIDQKKQDVRVYQCKTVVEEVENAQDFVEFVIIMPVWTASQLLIWVLMRALTLYLS